MATYKYLQNFSAEAGAGYVQYNIVPDFGTVLAPGESFEITGKIYSGKRKCYGISVEAVHIGTTAWHFELGKCKKTISAGKSATFSIAIAVPDLSETEETTRKVLPTYLNFGFLENAELDVGETTDRFGEQMLALIKERIAPVISGVKFSDDAGTVHHFGGAVQGKTDLIAEVQVQLDPIDEALTIKRAEFSFGKDGLYEPAIVVQGEAISGKQLHIGIPQFSGNYDDCRLILTDSKDLQSEYFTRQPFDVFPYKSPSVSGFSGKDVVERYEISVSDTGEEVAIASDAGRYLWANFITRVTPIMSKNKWELVRSWAEYGSEPSEEPIVSEFAGNVNIRAYEDQSIFPRTIVFSENKRYTVWIEIRDYFESTMLRFDVDKAGGYFNIEKYGVSAGMRSTGTAKKPKFESVYPLYPYNGVAMCPDAVVQIPLELDASGKFRLYKEETSPFCLMQYGNIVYLEGEITPASSISGSATEHIIATLPEGFAPKYSRTYLCQGTGTALWMLRVYAADNEEYPSKITFGRYRSGSSYANCAAGNWLPVSVSWICGGTVVQEGDIEVKFTVSADGAATITGVELTVNANGDATIPMEYLSVQDGAAVIG